MRDGITETIKLITAFTNATLEPRPTLLNLTFDLENKVANKGLYSLLAQSILLGGYPATLQSDPLYEK